MFSYPLYLPRLSKGWLWWVSQTCPETLLKFHPDNFIGWLISGCTFLLLESSHHSYILPPRFPPPSAQMRWESLPQLKTRNSLCHPPLSEHSFPGGVAAPAPVPDQSKICWFQRWCSWYCLVCSLLHTGPNRYLTAKDTKSRERKKAFVKRENIKWLLLTFLLLSVSLVQIFGISFGFMLKNCLKKKSYDAWEHRVPTRKFDLVENRLVISHIFVLSHQSKNCTGQNLAGTEDLTQTY